MASPSITAQGLLLRALAGDEAALGELLEQHRAYLKLLTRGVLDHCEPRAVDGSDIVQQTYLSAVRAFPEFRGGTPGEFAAWLREIHHHTAVDAVRRSLALKRGADKREPLLDEPLARQTTPSQRMMQDERAVELAAAIERLPEDQQEAVRLRHLQGWSLADIARRMERSETAAAGLVKRGLSTLRELMRE